MSVYRTALGVYAGLVLQSCPGVKIEGQAARDAIVSHDQKRVSLLPEPLLRANDAYQHLDSPSTLI